MEAPDKIFLPGDIDWPSAAILTLGKQPGDVEYIRKDALLEWLNDQIEVYDAHLKGQNDAAWWHERYAFKQVIDKLNSL